MKNVLIASAIISVLFLFMHEFDAFKRGEWKMFTFLNRLGDEMQYRIFLYAHVPLTLFTFFYLWTVISFNNWVLWIGWNIFSVFHLLLHLVALRWKSNVFKGWDSFVFVVGAGLTGLVNLFLVFFY